MSGDLSPEDEYGRLLGALTTVVAARGFKDTAVEDVLKAAGLGQDSFDRHFPDKEACFLAAWDLANEEYIRRAFAAFSAAEDVWRVRMRVVAEASLRFVQEDPDRSRLILEARNAGPAARARLEATMDAFVSLVDLGRQEMEDPDSLTRSTAEGIGGAVFEQIGMQLKRGDAADLPGLLPQLMFMLVQPYLGMDEAMKEMREAGDREGRGATG
jgi:AcrR family transcriptional regulator